MIDTLVIIGNGFDMWQGINTSYHDFETYYISHRDEIMHHLHIKPYDIRDDAGRYISDVEMLYGDPFNPELLSHDFWNRYEDSLALIDDQRINLYFGKETKGLRSISFLSQNAKKILQEAFSSWIGSKRIEPKDSEYSFSDNCFIINFNYTNTVEIRFGVPEDRIYHIHGESDDKESIIVGHSLHPEYALPQLAEMGGRFTGLYFIEDALYESDKHVDDNYQDMLLWLALSGVNPKNIKNVYVLGHSFGEADYSYFKHLAYAMNDADEDPFEDIPDWCLEYLAACDEMGFLNLNLAYAIHHRERLGKKGDIEELPGLETFQTLDKIMQSAAEDPYYSLPLEQQRILEKAAVRARFIMEQSVRDVQREIELIDVMSEIRDDVPKVSKRKRKKIMKELEKIGWKDCQEMIQEAYDNRKNTGCQNADNKQPPLWHISYYSDSDRRRIEDVMERVHCNNYKLYNSIDGCIAKFRTV